MTLPGSERRLLFLKQAQQLPLLLCGDVPRLTDEFDALSVELHIQFSVEHQQRQCVLCEIHAVSLRFLLSLSFPPFSGVARYGYHATTPGGKPFTKANEKFSQTEA